MIALKNDKNEMTNADRYILLTQYIDERYDAYALVRGLSLLTAHGEGAYAVLEDLENFIKQLEEE